MANRSLTLSLSASKAAAEVFGCRRCNQIVLVLLLVLVLEPLILDYENEDDDEDEKFALSANPPSDTRVDFE